MESKTPVSVITGFLGSGKTTLLNALLKHPRMAETAVLVNEFGEIGIDHLLVEALDDDVLLLAAGCLCCTIREDMVASLRSLFERRAGGQVPEFRRVVVETHGTRRSGAHPAHAAGWGFGARALGRRRHRHHRGCGQRPPAALRVPRIGEAGRGRRPAPDHQGRHRATAGARRPARAASGHQPRSASPGGMPRRRRAGRSVRFGSVFPEQRPASGREPLAGRGRDRAPPSPPPCGRPR